MADIYVFTLWFIIRNTRDALHIWPIFSMFFRFEIEIEPIFGTLALYDVKEKKKVFFVPIDFPMTITLWNHLRNAELILN